MHPYTVQVVGSAYNVNEILPYMLLCVWHLPCNVIFVAAAHCRPDLLFFLLIFHPVNILQCVYPFLQLTCEDSRTHVPGHMCTMSSGYGPGGSTGLSEWLYHVTPPTSHMKGTWPHILTSPSYHQTFYFIFFFINPVVVYWEVSFLAKLT